MLFEKVICIAVAVVLGLLLLACLFITGINPDPNVEFIELQESTLMQSGGACLLALVIALCVRCASQIYDHWLFRAKSHFLLITTCILTTGVAVTWILATGTVPEADQRVAYDCAWQFLHGDVSIFAKGAYMGLCPNNLGIMALWMVLITFFGPEPFLAYKLLQAAFLAMMVLSGWKVTHYLSHGKINTQFLFCFFAVTCFPIYGYATFMYNDLFGAILMYACSWCFLSCMSQFSISRCLLLGLLAGIAYLVRFNTIILLFALELILVVYLLRQAEYWLHYVSMGAAMLAGIILEWTAFSGIFPVPEDSHPLPALAYIYMASRESSHPGWFNAASLDLYKHYNYDVTATNKAALSALGTTVKHYLHDPTFFWYFYKSKLVSQWTAPMYQCLAMPRLYSAHAGYVVKDIYTRRGAGMVVEKYMKAYQLLCYASIFLLLLRQLATGRMQSASWYAILLAFWGEFFFSLLWEAKTRYVFPYFLLLLPYVSNALAGDIFAPVLKGWLRSGGDRR